MVSPRLLEVEARYLSAEGKAVHTRVGDLCSDRLVHGLPVRGMPTYAGQRNYPGLFWSATTGSLICYESRLECSRLLLADHAVDVTWIASHPVWLIGHDCAAVRKHVPELLLQLAGRRYLLTAVMSLLWHWCPTDLMRPLSGASVSAPFRGGCVCEDRVCDS